jgi:hypothetical protein
MAHFEDLLKKKPYEVIKPPSLQKSYPVKKEVEKPNWFSTITKSVSDFVSNIPNMQIPKELEPSKELQGLSDQAKNYAEQNKQGLETFKKVRDFVLPKPSSEEEAKKMGMINVGTKEKPSYLDITGGMMGIENVGKNIITKIAKETKPSVIKSLLKEIGGIADDIIPELSQKLSKITKSAEVENVIGQVKDIIKKEDYHTLVYSGDKYKTKFVKAQNAKTVPNNMGLDLFVSKNKDGLWAVSEAKSGKAITRTYSTKNEAVGAIDETLQMAKDRGVDIKKTIDESISEHGLSPKYDSTPSTKKALPEVEQVLKTTEKPQLPKQAIQQIESKTKTQTPKLRESLEQTLKLKEKNPQIVSSLTNDTTKLIKNIGVNVDNLKISDIGKKLIDETIQEVKPAIQQRVGKVLTNKEIIDVSERSAKILKGAVGSESTKNWEVALLNARKKLAASAESGIVDRDFIETLLTVKTQGTDIARKLQSFGIGADAQNITSKQAILESILKQNQNIDDILKASQGVDFNDFNQAVEFYRKFIKPTAGEWIDLLRYNSMLSSPKTHLVNTFSNLLNTTLIAPLEKAMQGGIDFLSSKITGNARKVFAGESAKFIEGYFSNLKKATINFADVLKGKSPITQLDLKYIPFSKEGAKGKIAKVLSYPTRLLEASDRFFIDLTEAGERAALEYRVSKGVAVKEIEEKALDTAKYRLYRQELFSPEQGNVLDAIDHFTSTLMGLRNAKNPIVSTISKFTVPFVKTPMNIFKQGVEYSPLGLSTVIGAKNKQQQLAKAMLGSAFFAGAATLLTSDRLTGAEPRDTTGIRDWRSAGKQAYSVKIGNKWVSYQKFPPAISFSFSLLSTINDTLKDKKIDDNIVDITLSAVSKYGQFLSDQSYAKSIGDMLGAIQGGEAGIERIISNYPQQLIPFRALGSWFARMFDASQRKVDSQADFIDKQIQQLFINMPFLSMTVPARLDKDGNPIPNYNRFWNAFSPIDIKTENEKFSKFLNDKEQFNKALKIKQDEKTKIKESVRLIYNNVQKLVSENKIEEAKNIVNSLTDEEYEQYKSIKSSEKSKQTTELEARVFPTYQKVQDLLSEGKEQEAKNIVNGLTDEEYKAYKLIKNRLK